ncbi:hypothetical protein [Nocardioides panacihumi]
MLVSLVVVGAMWLLLLAAPWGIDDFEGLAFFVIVATYVVAGGLAMGALYARDEVTMRQEILTLLTLWLVAVALWTGIFLNLGVKAEHDPDTAYLVNGVSWTDSIYFALWIATPCFIVWQVPALVSRIVWRRVPSRLKRVARNASPGVRGT